MNDYCEVIARKCKIPDPSLRLIDSTRFTLSQAHRVVLGSATLAYRYRTRYRTPTTIRQCVAGLRLDSDRFALPRRATLDCEPCNNLNDGDIVDYIMLCAVPV
jgi:hypothetical protein